ncbi:uncharacterized protein LOC134801944 [Cydia splendana]|uniref:uncharacterized protein LOC134801944 n=1 Tax=Cydia splendana TaxID=1100963 RepID=UPI00300C5D43
MFCSLSPDGSCLNEMSIAQSIISQALPALSPRLNLTFSPKTSDRTRLVDSQNYPDNKTKETRSSLQANLSQLEATINANKSPIRDNEANETQTPKSEPRVHSDKVQTVVTPSKWPLKPGVLVHVNSNHTLSPKNQARMAANVSQNNDKEEDATLGLLERNRVKSDDERSPTKSEYSKKNGKPRRHTQNVVSGIFKNLRRKSDNDSDDDSGKYKKINKTNKRAVSLVNLNKPGYSLPKSRIRSFFQSEAPNVIVTEGGSCQIILNSFILINLITK